jgi:DNA mismatch endonuclease (patch repair protein)
MPKSRIKFWRAKFEGNVERDARKQADLAAAGWRVVVVWECKTRDTFPDFNCLISPRRPFS